MEIVMIVKSQFGVVVKKVGYKLGDCEFSPPLGSFEPVIISQS